MQEIENIEGVLQNFRVEIKKIKENFPSLFAVENVDDLEVEEYKVWEEYKLLFKKTVAELSKFDMNQKDVLTNLSDEINKLAADVVKKLNTTSNLNRKEFLAWINNRLGILSLNLQLLQNSSADETTLLKSMEHLSEEKRGLLL